MKLNHRQFRGIVYVMTVTLALLPFQNCAKKSIDFKNNPSAEEPLPEVKQVDVVVGQDTIAPLKMVFIIDNSMSMAANFAKTETAITNMFDESNLNNLSDFEVEIFFITTAQRAESTTILDSTSVRAPASIIQSELDNARQATLNTGLIAGDALGFGIGNETVTSLDLSATKRIFTPAPISQFDNSTGNLVPKFSIKFKKGSTDPNIAGDLSQVLTAVRANLKVVDPTLTSQLGIEAEASSADGQKAIALDNESGLCAMARILRSPDSIIEEGDLASFVLISDENESDPTGADCLASIKKEKKIASAICEKRATNVNLKTIKYTSNPGIEREKVRLNLFDKDFEKAKVQTVLTLAPKKSACYIDYDNGFNIKYKITKPKYRLSFSKREPYPRRADSTSASYKAAVTQTTDILAAVPGAGSCNLALVKAKIPALANAIDGVGVTDPTQISNITCTALASDVSGEFGILINYGTAHPVELDSLDLSTEKTDLNSLDPAIQTFINAQMTTEGNKNKGTASDVTFNFVKLYANHVTKASITGTIAGSSGDYFTSSACDGSAAAITNYCSNSSGTSVKRNCTFNAASTYATKSSVVISSAALSSNDIGFSCDSKCTDFPGLCAGEVSLTKTVNTWKTENGYGSCSAATTNSNSNFIKQDTTAEVKDLVIAKSLFDSYVATAGGIASNVNACDFKCSELGLVCPDSSKAVTEYYRCTETQASRQTIAASSSTIVTLGSVIETGTAVTCDSFCTDGLCGLGHGSQKIKDYIATIGSQCTASSELVAGPIAIEKIPVVNKYSEEAQTLCSAANITLKPNESLALTDVSLDLTATTLAEKVANAIPGNDTPTLSQYIASRVEEIFGEGRFKFSAFIKDSDDPLSGAQSEGVVYTALAGSLEGASVQSVDLASYNDSLSFLSGELASVLKRSYKVPRMMRGEHVDSVQIIKYFDGTTVDLTPSQYISKGNVLTIKDSVALEPLDQIKINLK